MSSIMDVSGRPRLSISNFFPGIHNYLISAPSCVTFTYACLQHPLLLTSQLKQFILIIQILSAELCQGDEHGVPVS